MTSTATATPTRVMPKVGDYFYASWGYDQTNVTFFEVMGVTPSGKSVKVREVTTSTTGSNGPSDEATPGSPKTGGWVRTDGVSTYDPTYEAPAQTKRLNWYGERPVFTWTSYANAYLWDGKPKYQTGWGYGH